MSEYRYLEIGEEIKAGDEFRRPNGDWVLIPKTSIDIFIKEIGKPLCFRRSDLSVRRVIEND